MIIACLLIFLINVFPCYQTGPQYIDIDVVILNGSYSQTNFITVDSRREYVLVFQPQKTRNPFRITAWADAKPESPVLIVVRQEKQVTSWQIPMIVETTRKSDAPLILKNTSNTMCHNDMKEIREHSEFSMGNLQLSQSFIISITTFSPNKINVSLSVNEEQNFYVKPNREYALSISPSDPRYVYFKFDKHVAETVVIEVDSEDDICLTVSVQDSTCPVLDTNKDITYEGYYQTVTTKGALTISKQNKFQFGFFLVFVAKPDNYDCSQGKSLLPIVRTTNIIFANRTSNITFKIKNSINSKDYTVASLVTLTAYIVFAFLAIMTSWAFTKWGQISKLVRQRDAMDIVDAVSFDHAVPQTNEQIANLLTTKRLTLKSLAQFPQKDKRRSFNYLWHILSIAIFYSIPVVQLVVTYQRVVNTTGNQDMCYYNFLCAHPKFGFSDFNHIYSNIGYIFTGFLFIFNILYRHYKIPINYEVGIPVHYGLFYAMGVALIIEGLLSASYHICPSQSNYQFDTSFMYVMAVLCMVKLYQNRHPDINATAYATFTVLGAAIFLAMIGIINGSFAVWLGFIIVYSILCVYISVKIYYLSFVIEGFQNMRVEFSEHGFSCKIFKPLKLARFALLLIANIANYAMLVSGLIMYNYQVTDFGTFLLALLMGNSIIHAIFYTLMKLMNHEKLCPEAIVYGILAILCWISATIFFLDAATLWTVTPAESRQWNQGCIVMNFYDKHDIWHLLSGPALYLTFMFLLCLDDDLINTKQSEIEVTTTCSSYPINYSDD